MHDGKICGDGIRHAGRWAMRYSYKTVTVSVWPEIFSFGPDDSALSAWIVEESRADQPPCGCFSGLVFVISHQISIAPLRATLP
ncbi:MAG: hypothetical protein AAGB04_28090, partial [Pseudomonadota bacterium]